MKRYAQKTIKREVSRNPFLSSTYKVTSVDVMQKFRYAKNLETTK